MIWGVVSIVLALCLTYLQFYEGNKSIRRVAVGLAILIVIVQSGMMYKENVASKYQLQAIERIGTTIDWNESEVKINYINTKKELESSDVRVDLKFYSVVKSNFPKHSKVNLGQIKRNIEFFEKNGLGVLSDFEAAKIFLAYAKSSGDIYWDEEKKGKVQRALYYKKDIKEVYPGTSIMTFGSEWLPDVQSPYLSLLDLNDGFIVARIQATGIEKARSYAIQIKLKSNLGDKNLYVMLRQIDPENKIDLTSPVRYVGIYIPEGYFNVVGG